MRSYKPSPDLSVSVGLSPRSVFLGLLATILLAIVTPISDLWIQGTWLAACHLPIGVLVIFVFLQLVINPLLYHLRAPLTHAELITIYGMMLVSAGIPSLGFAAYLIPVLASPAYYQTPENEWATTFFHYIPNWLAPMDAKASRLFYEGAQVQSTSHFFAFNLPPIPWAVWIKPLVAWGLFALGLFLAMTCLCALIRRQWIERERLIFPLVQLPLEMLGPETQSPSAIPMFFRSRMAWLGIALPTFVHGWNGLHFHFPVIPEIPLFYDLGRYFTEKPWNVVRPLWAIIHFSAIGFVYLLPTDLAFSLWFFYFLFHAEAIVITQLGLPLGQSTGYATKGFAAYQMAGAILLIALAALWRARHYLADLIRLAFNPTPTAKTESLRYGEGDEPMSPRAAWIGLLLGIGVMSLWSVIAGVSFILILIVICLFLLTMIAMTRMVSEGGMLFIQTPFRPVDLISPYVGTNILGGSSLTILAFQEMIFMFDVRSSMMPSVMDTFKLVDSSRLKQRRLMPAIATSVIISMAVSSVTVLIIGYRYGGINLSSWFFIGAPQLPFRRLTGMLFYPQEPNGYSILMMGIGATVTIALTALRTRFLWWQFHPIGFAMGPSWPMIQLWCSVLIGWFCKWTVLRSGGIGLYRRWRPFFLGLVLGEFLSGGLWLIIDFWVGKQGHRIFLF